MTIARLGANVDRLTTTISNPPVSTRVARDGLVLVGLIFNAAIFVIAAPIRQTLGADAFAYWSVKLADPYALPNGAMGAFLYSPVIARLFAPSATLSWPQFWWLWLAILVATTVWLGWSRLLFLLAFPPVALELYYGNVNLLIGAAIALGFRYPATWAFVLLTKITPGVGLIWFLVRREWRALAIAVGVTVVLASASALIDGRLWEEWLRILPQPGEPAGNIPIPLALRFTAAAILVAWGAQTNRRWTVPVGATLAMPVLWLGTLSALAALAAIDRPQLTEAERS